MRKDLFMVRQSLCDRVFTDARNELIAFTKTPGYLTYLQNIAEQILALFPDDSLIVYISNADQEKTELLQMVTPNSSFERDPKIAIGGIKVDIPARHLLIDETLDTKLKDQYAWFEENSGLKVV